MSADDLKPGAEDRASALLDILRAHPPTWEDARREAVWRRIEDAQARPKNWLRLSIPLAAAAAAAVAFLMLRPTPAPTPAPIPVVATQGALTLGSTTLPSGALVELASGAATFVADQDRTVITLSVGEVRSTVPKLGIGQSYIVRTPNAEITVRGTVFRVLTEPGQTQVQVDEGHVEVVDTRGSAPTLQLTAGQTGAMNVVDRTGAAAAEARSDWPRAISIWRALLDDMPDGLSRRNLMLAIGRKIDTHQPDFSVEFWRKATKAYPTGAHAEEFAYRLGISLKNKGLTKEAHQVGVDFRARFPRSLHAGDTRSW